MPVRYSEFARTLDLQQCFSKRVPTSTFGAHRDAVAHIGLAEQISPARRWALSRYQTGASLLLRCARRVGYATHGSTRRATLDHPLVASISICLGPQNLRPSKCMSRSCPQRHKPLRHQRARTKNSDGGPADVVSPPAHELHAGNFSSVPALRSGAQCSLRYINLLRGNGPATPPRPPASHSNRALTRPNRPRHSVFAYTRVAATPPPPPYHDVGRAKPHAVHGHFEDTDFPSRSRRHKPCESVTHRTVPHRR